MEISRRVSVEAPVTVPTQFSYPATPVHVFLADSGHRPPSQVGVSSLADIPVVATFLDGELVHGSL
jgi:hypothetical protein